MIFNRVENGSTARVLNKQEDLSMTKICQLERFVDCSLFSLRDLVAIGFAGVGTTHLRQEYTRETFMIEKKKSWLEGKQNLSRNVWHLWLNTKEYIRPQ
jgi:hypothetical protein